MDRQSVHQAAKENPGSAAGKGVVVFNCIGTEIVNERTDPIETKEI